MRTQNVDNQIITNPMAAKKRLPRKLKKKVKNMFWHCDRATTWFTYKNRMTRVTIFYGKIKIQ